MSGLFIKTAQSEMLRREHIRQAWAERKAADRAPDESMSRDQPGNKFTGWDFIHDNIEVGRHA